MVNLNRLASELTSAEGLRESISKAQVAEVLGLLGARWRAAGGFEPLEEFMAIVRRAGVRSGHRRPSRS